MSLSFSQIQQAWQAQDPSLVDKLYILATQQDDAINKPISEHALTFDRFLDKALSHQFRQQHPEVQFAERVAMLSTLEADEGVYPLPDRYKIHLILIALWEDGSPYSRAILKQAISLLPISYGVWKGVKRIYKQAESAQDYEMFGHIAAKIDLHRFDQKSRSAVSMATKTYMSLRAWRYLRQLGQQMPICYIDAAVHVLASYDDSMTAGSPEQMNSWVLNHICFHNSIGYGVNRFSNKTTRKLFDAKGRAFIDAWQRDSEPLLMLLATAKNEAVRQFATDSLKHDFKTQLRDVSSDTIQYLSAGQAHSPARDEMIVWLLETSPHFEKSQFRALGLHEVVLTLLHSDFAAAYQYAISYAKSYAQDLALAELMFLAISDYAPVREFAINNILSRDPITEVGINGWGQLLDTKAHYNTAIQQLSKHFTRRDLTPDWFFNRLISGKPHSVKFAIQKLPELYSAKELGSEYFIRVAQQLDLPAAHHPSTHNDSYYYHNSDGNDSHCMDFVLDQLKRLDLSQVNAAVWQMLLLNPLSQSTIIDWIDEDILSAATLDMSYWHALAYEPDWQVSEYIEQLKSADNPIKNWQTHLIFDEYLAENVRDWLSDVRRFAPIDLGFDWLMQLAHSEQAVYREFAIDRINKGFLPADFVAYFDSSSDISTGDAAPDASAEDVSTNDMSTEVDLSGQRYLFTGKMQSMTRGDAEKVVKAANGAISSAVNGKLDYLVIGDDGSPLYGNGRKGSKQVKAESLIADGAPLKIISETAFLQMLSGQSREVSEDDTLEGAQALWHMATDDAAAPISELALSYLSHHHEHICMALTDRPVDPDAIIPSAFFNAERIIPLLQHRNNRLRDFGLLVSEYEMATWQPTPALWLTMAESPFYEATQLLKRALLDKPSTANRRYHIDAAQLNKAMLNAFINSKKSLVRQIGIALLQRHPKFQDVQSLYQLTQSTDREVRYAAVTMLWQHYKARHISPNWQPFVINDAQDKPNSKGSISAKAVTVPSPQAAKRLSDDMPADIEQLLLLLRRGLFELPPGRLGGAQDSQHQDKNSRHKGDENHSDTTLRLKPIAASQAKLALIETFRDVGLTDSSFAALILPTLFTFTKSAGKMERHACLVAVTRLLHRYPELSASLQPVASA
ncbi:MULTISPECIES: BRCT domain-containing protein [unclassified Psychrobacter]|uniref:BRCT domain-containing protein n=1 Tax=unclassified Psychrobacter TaxID=196806 RepID=UPI0025B477EB|nr:MULTISPECIES: BRCT domain-containing protein [unclassified Psychrobacter]MDN3453123.1 BRCT domain-containing protein [Psychrobacter sp. APC 3350]MDN3501922.1 BRCT domain-containing protein [Psychrobacter sp. 5A.1]